MSLQQLIDLATKEYGASEGTFWLAAFPASVPTIRRCELAEPRCATIVDDRALLPLELNGKELSATVILDRPFRLYAFSLCKQGRDGLERFLSFTAHAVHLLGRDPPSWGKGMADAHEESPFLTWAAFLFFVAPAGHGYAKPSREAAIQGNLVTIRTPWTASLAVLKDWELEKHAEAAKGETPAPRLTVNLERKTVTLDGQSFDVSSVHALRWLKVLSKHPGEWISSADLKRFDNELEGARADRLKKHLPNSVQELIDSETGKGSRLRLA